MAGVYFVAIDLYLILAMGLLGGLCRALIGYGKVFELRIPFDVGRAWFSFLLATLSGALAAALATSLLPTLPQIAVAIIAGLGGPDTLEAAWRGLAKKLGGSAGQGGRLSFWSASGAGGAGAAFFSISPLNDRQLVALQFARRRGRITNQDYQRIAGVSQSTATRDLTAMKGAGVLKAKRSGRGAYYVLTSYLRKK